MPFKKIILAFFVLFNVSIVFAADKAPSASVELEKLLQNTKTFQADFSQITISEDSKVLKNSSGSVQFKRPGLFRWETLGPSHQIVITGSRWLWIYDVDLKQVTKQRINPDMLTPATVLSGDTDNLLRQFVVEKAKSGDRLQFVLNAKAKDAGFKQVMIYFVGTKLTGLTVVSQMGERNRFTFSKIKVNIPLDASLFAFVPPRGVDVLKSR